MWEKLKTEKLKTEMGEAVWEKLKTEKLKTEMVEALWETLKTEMVEAGSCRILAFQILAF